MRCKFCGTDPDPIVLVPNVEKRKYGQIEIFSCLDCAIKQGIYCEKHECPHTGFSGDETTACLRCIEEEVQMKKEVAEEVYARICGALPQEELDGLQEFAEDSSVITGDDESVSVFRFVITTAHRFKLPWDQVVVQILERRSAAIILPSPF
ncbi:MAG: hypothetical protein HYS78_01565 [Parcubacteria group bacterium]|nr:hypothetical protein [Parcubacteria group bacterium]